MKHEAKVMIDGVMQQPLDRRRFVADWLRGVASQIERASPEEWAVRVDFNLERPKK